LATHLLLVDDHREFAAAAQELLEARGYRVTVAEDGVEALEVAAREVPDLVILDIMMPRLNGWQTLEALRQRPSTAEVPVLVLTARKSSHDIAQTFAAGGTWYYAKPISDFEDFVLVIGQLLENPHGEQPE
jgi:CheY-like chemotaxis protein